MEREKQIRICRDDDMDMMLVEDCCQILDSMRVPVTASDREEGEYPYYGANGIQDYVADYIFDDELVLLAEDGGNFGSKEKPIAYRVSGKCWVNNHAHVLKPKDGLDVDYLCYSLMFYKVGGMVNGATRQKLTQAAMCKMQIPLRSMDEQKFIVDELNRIIRIKEQRQQELQLLDHLIKARFVEMFGDPYVNPLKWKKLKIKDAVTIEPQNGLYKPQSDYVTDGSGIPILRIDGFYDGMVTDFASLKRLKCSETERQRYLLLEDDIVINRVNSIEYLGKCAHIKDLAEDTVYESNMMRMHFDPEYYNPVYICKLLCSQFIYDQIVNHAKKSVNQASINQKDVLDFNIYQPPLDLQNEFANFVQQVDKSKVAVQKALDETQLLFDSLMQQYFG